jgi:tetratricopeptide (TPR) repeat protein
MELARPARLGCLSVTDLAASLPGMRFPVDVSGGVPRFRHRRGELQRLEVELGARPLERWASPRLRGLVGTRAPEVWVAVARAAATVGIGSQADPEEEEPRASPVLAFDVRVLAEGEDLVLVVEQARGADLPRSATAMAIACVGALLGDAAERQGAAFLVRDGAGAIARTLLPEAGARVPEAKDVRWTSVAAASDVWVLHAVQGGVAAAPSDEAIRARELAMLLREADDALVADDEEAARALCMDALERAPRHAEIVRRIVDLDVRAGGRAEAALAMLSEARASGPDAADARLGTTPGELLLETGDVEAALASLERAGDTEPSPALAARAFEAAARAARDPEEAARWLDRGLARSPRSASARWLRVLKRLALGRLEDAAADVEHLEALARGGRAKHLVWLRAGRAWAAAGLASRAGDLFERALRFVPDEPRALAGLGEALVGDGREARGVAVLERALAVAESARGKRGEEPDETARIRVALGRALAEHLGDLPTAVAHVAAIPAEADEAPLARGLEGRWRARLGDLAGAGLAFARLRELSASFAAGSDDPRAGTVAALLGEAAQIELLRQRDPLAAQRHLAAALRLRPRDAELLRAYRDAGALVVRDAGGDALEDRVEDEEPLRPVAQSGFPPVEGPSATHITLTDRPPAARPLFDLSLPSDSEPPVDLDATLLENAEARIEDLTRKLLGDPANDAVADELGGLLERAGRGHELLALLSGRMEDATPERRKELAPKAKAALLRLAEEAEAAGRKEEASLFRGAADALEP